MLVLTVFDDIQPAAEVTQLADGCRAGRIHTPPRPAVPARPAAPARSPPLPPPRGIRYRQVAREQLRTRPRRTPRRRRTDRFRCALPPSSKSSAWARIVFPAPVSPVRTLAHRRAAARHLPAAAGFSTRQIVDHGAGYLYQGRSEEHRTLTVRGSAPSTKYRQQRRAPYRLPGVPATGRWTSCSCPATSPTSRLLWEQSSAARFLKRLGLVRTSDHVRRRGSGFRTGSTEHRR